MKNRSKDQQQMWVWIFYFNTLVSGRLKLNELALKKDMFAKVAKF